MMEKVILAGLRLDDEFEYKMDELKALTKAATQIGRASCRERV